MCEGGWCGKEEDEKKTRSRGATKSFAGREIVAGFSRLVDARSAHARVAHRSGASSEFLSLSLSLVLSLLFDSPDAFLPFGASKETTHER